MQDSLVQRRFDQAADAGAQPHAPFIDALAGLIVQRLQLRPSDSLVDLGCGSGALIALAEPALQRGGAVGVDFSRGQIESARRRFSDPRPGNSKLRPRFIRENAEATSLADRSADGVALNFVLPYSDDPMRLVREAARIARPDARIAASVAARPLLGLPWDRLLAAARRESAEPPEIDDRFNHRRLAEFAFFADLRDIVIEEIEREFHWDSVDQWLASLQALAFTPDWPPPIADAIRLALRDDDRVAAEDGRVRCQMKLLVISAVAP